MVKIDQKIKKMRVRFDQQIKLGVIPISEVKLNLRSRHGLLPVLRALQYVFKTPELNESIFKILEEKVKSNLQETGRYGMSMWEILVLGVIRLNENADFDQLHDLANEHRSVRSIMGVEKSDYTIGKTYSLQTIKDNVQLLDDETIYKISEIIVSGSHGLIKKKEATVCLNLSIKADSFVVESTIHFPTDLNLLWDSSRKTLETSLYFQKGALDLVSNFHSASWQKKVKKAYRWSSEIHRKKGANYQERLEESVESYLAVSREVSKRGKCLLLEIKLQLHNGIKLTNKDLKKLSDLEFYLEMMDKHIDLVNRRILLGEKIPHSEKVFSIFEQHVEWNSKGKVNKGVELGHNVLITTDQYHNILYAEVYEKQVDKQRTKEVGDQLQKRYGIHHILDSISFDRGFYSLPAEKSLSTQFKIVVLPKAGRPSKRELAEGENEAYQKVKRKHSGVEGNINQLEQNGLDICPDKGIAGFKRYVAYGVLSYNLHRLGMRLILAERKAAKRAKRKADRKKVA